jgi:hypothetical protein
MICWRSIARWLSPVAFRPGCGCSTVKMSWRDKIARFLGLNGVARPDGIRPWPGDDIDPIEELDRIINETQDRDDLDERRFDVLERIAQPKSKRPTAGRRQRGQRS